MMIGFFCTFTNNKNKCAIVVVASKTLKRTYGIAILHHFNINRLYRKSACLHSLTSFCPYIVHIQYVYIVQALSCVLCRLPIYFHLFPFLLSRPRPIPSLSSCSFFVLFFSHLKIFTLLSFHLWEILVYIVSKVSTKEKCKLFLFYLLKLAVVESFVIFYGN